MKIEDKIQQTKDELERLLAKKKMMPKALQKASARNKELLDLMNELMDYYYSDDFQINAASQEAINKRVFTAAIQWAFGEEAMNTLISHGKISPLRRSTATASESLVKPSVATTSE